MAGLWSTYRTMPRMLLLLGIISIGASLCATAEAQQTSPPGSQSWTDSITSPVKQGFDKLGRALSPKPSAPAIPEDDAVSLKNTAKPGAELYVAVARLYEQAGKLADAEQQYQLALKEKPEHLPALLGYAHLKERLKKPNEAIQLYQRAAKSHPEQASVHNDLGLCYWRQDQFDDAVAAMNRAIQLDPKNPLYRNNIAWVLADQGKLREAFAQLREVHTPAAAYYNMGFLLNKKGQTQAAMQHFALALKADPSMDSARRWIDYLQRSTTQARLPDHPMANGVKVTGQPRMPEEDAMTLPEEQSPRRLPPTMLRQQMSDNPSVPGISYSERSADPSAPLPPPSANPALRPLPRVN